jgi:hypothetical protein
MIKKLGLLIAAVAVLAFAVPAAASAAPSITSVAGTKAPVNTKITGTASDVSFTSSTLGTITCDEVTIYGKLSENTGTSVKMGTEGEGTTENCEDNGDEISFSDITVTNLAMTVVNKGTLSFDATAHLPGALECVFTGTNVPFTYVSTTPNITFNKSGGIKAVPAGCGNITFDATFKLEIGGTAVILD